MDYTTLYVIFSIPFFSGAVGYWVVTRYFKDPSKIYVSGNGT